MADFPKTYKVIEDGIEWTVYEDYTLLPYNLQKLGISIANTERLKIVIVSTDGQINSIKYMSKGKLHNDNGPAVLTYSRKDNMILQEYWKNGFAYPKLTTVNKIVDYPSDFCQKCGQHIGWLGKFMEGVYWLFGLKKKLGHNCKDR